MSDAEVVTVDTDDMDGIHLVRITPDEGFACQTCDVDGYGDGYTLTPDGAQRWHDDVATARRDAREGVGAAHRDLWVELLTVRYLDTFDTFSVSARRGLDDEWTTWEGPAAELDSLLSIARDTMAGG